MNGATDETIEVHGIMWQPNGNFAILTGTNGFVRVYDPTTKTLHEVDADTKIRIAEGSWKPGANFAVAVGPTKIRA